jgi:hypothetical protein
MRIKAATVKNINNDQMIEDVTQEYGTLAPVESKFQFFTIDDLESQMLSTGDKLIYQTLEDLISERKNWEEVEYFLSNERKYSILTKCYSIFQSLKGTSDEARLARKSFNRFIISKGFKQFESDHLMTQVIIVVFGGKSRRTSKYSRALRVASDDSTPVNELKDYILKFGGLDEVIRSKKEDGMPRNEKGRGALYGKALTIIKDSNISDEINMTDYPNNDAVLLLATYDEDSDEINVLRVIQNNAAIKAAFTSLASKVTNTELQALLDAEYE